MRGATDQAHHIVAGKHQFAEAARDILARAGIDINEAANGVFLAQGKHQAIHTKEYYKALTSRLEGAAPGDLRNVLGTIRDEILAGTFPH